MTATETAASTMPTVECWASLVPSSDRRASTVTKPARAKKDTAMMRSARRSRARRRSWSDVENCQATAAADATSTTESSPKPIRAEDEATVPAVRAMTASTTL